MEERRVRGVVIDSGHGGVDPGAVWGNLREKDFNLKASLYMRDRLRALGIPVAMTMEVDQTLPREERIRRIRTAFGAHPDVIVVSNHINAGGGEGAEVIYALRNRDTLARLVLENIGAKGQVMRRVFQQRLASNPSLDHFFIIRDTNPIETILVEYGFIDNARDRVRLQNNLLDFVEGAVRAIAIYTNTPYAPPGGNITGGEFHTVVSGDTLSSIARRYSITVAELRRLNNLTTDTLRIGQRLRVRESSTTPDSNTYIVQIGDTLWSISNRFNIPVVEIRRLNNLTSDTLRIGQSLILREEGQHTIYIVASGDSLWSIANRFNTTVNELISLNNLTTNVLRVGQQLRIPGTNTSSPIIGEYDTYIVVSGDTLWSIANRYNIDINELRRINNLTTDTLTIGQRLRVPRVSSNTYTVQSGDSLWSIAKRFNITVDRLRQLNNITNDMLRIGQILIIR